MPLLRSAARLLLAGAAFSLISAAAEAQIRYISAGGKNVNDCETPATACRNLQRGIDVTPAGGELRILNSAAYGNGSIPKSITIAADDVSVFLLNAPLTINGTGAVVTLRGLSLNGGGSITTGIRVSAAAAAVHIEDCTIERFAGSGIYAAAYDLDLFVSDSQVHDNGAHGLYYKGSSIGSLTVDNSRFENNGSIGIVAERIQTSITRVIAAGNGSAGIQMSHGFGTVTGSAANYNGAAGYVVTGEMVLESSVARGNSVGLKSTPTASQSSRISSLTVTS